MKNSIQKSIALLLTFMVSISVFGCNQKDADKNSNNEQQETSGRIANIKDTNDYFVQDSKSEYKIVISQNAAESEIYAAEELQTFANKASGVELEVVSDEGKVFNSNDKYISIGETNLYKNSKTDLSEVAKKSKYGYIVRTYDKTAIIKGCSQTADIYGVYCFMNVLFEFETYANDEMYVKTSKDIKWKDLNIIDFPDFEGRDAHDLLTFKDADFATRLRCNGSKTQFKEKHGEGCSIWSYGLRGHCSFMLLPPEKYGEDHPEWYGGKFGGKDKRQLCYSKLMTDDEMFNIFIENLKGYIEAEPYAELFSIAQQDYWTWCDCDECKANIEKYGTPGGMLVAAANKVGRAIKSWLQETHPERADKVKLVIFAYHSTLPAPIDENGEPIIKADDNILIRFACLVACYSHGYFNDKCTINVPYAEAMENWKKIGTLDVWTYSLMPMDYMIFLPDIYTTKNNLLHMKRIGVIDVLYQDERDAESPFVELKMYIQSKLMWNTELDLQTLVDDFFEKYYKEASSYMKELYFDMVNHSLQYADEHKMHFQPGGKRYDYARTLYPKSILDRWLGIIQKAMNVAKKIEDKELSKKIQDRVWSESILMRYHLIDLYGSNYDKATLVNMINLFIEDTERLGYATLEEDTQNGAFEHTARKRAEGWCKKYEVTL